MTYIVLRHIPGRTEANKKIEYDAKPWHDQLAAYEQAATIGTTWSKVYGDEHMHIFVSKETPSRITIFQRKED